MPRVYRVDMATFQFTSVFMPHLLDLERSSFDEHATRYSDLFNLASVMQDYPVLNAVRTHLLNTYGGSRNDSSADYESIVRNVLWRFRVFQPFLVDHRHEGARCIACLLERATLQISGEEEEEEEKRFCSEDCAMDFYAPESPE